MTDTEHNTTDFKNQTSSGDDLATDLIKDTVTDEEIVNHHQMCIDEEVQSFVSSDTSQSIVSDILYTNQRLIFKYPDGTYSYAFKCIKDPVTQKANTLPKDSWLQVKNQDIS